MKPKHIQENIVAVIVCISVRAELIYHIEVETKWSSFFKRYFEMQFLVWKILYFVSNSTAIRGQINNKSALVQMMA